MTIIKARAGTKSSPWMALATWITRHTNVANWKYQIAYTIWWSVNGDAHLCAHTICFEQLANKRHCRKNGLLVQQSVEWQQQQQEQRKKGANK